MQDVSNICDLISPSQIRETGTSIVTLQTWTMRIKEIKKFLHGRKAKYFWTQTQNYGPQI